MHHPTPGRRWRDRHRITSYNVCYTKLLRTLQRKLNRLIPPQRYDNTLLEDTLQVTDAAVLGIDRPVTVYRARQGGVPAGLSYNFV